MSDDFELEDAAALSVLEDLAQEVLGGQPLSLEPALHVGDREQHGVNRAVRDRRA